MPGIHKNRTIAFRPSEWQKHLIDERAALSGMFKKDFITRSCLFDSIIVTGTKENIDRIVASVQEMEAVLIHKKVPERAKNWKVSLEEEQFRHILQMDAEKENRAKGVVEKDT